MRLCQATLREIQMPLVRPFETSFGRTTVRRILLVEVNVDGAIGWGECVAGERPSYSPETIETAWLLLRDFIWPAISGKEFGSASEVWEMLAPIRGHNMAKGCDRGGHMGCRGAAEVDAVVEAAGRRDPGDLLRRLHRHSGERRRTGARGGKGAGRRLSAHQDQDQAGATTCSRWRACGGAFPKFA